MWERKRTGAVEVFSGEKSLNTDSVDALRNLLEECANNGQPRLVMDFQQVPLIDSAGLELLLDIREACLRRGGQFQLAALNPLCTDILKVTGLASRFEIHKNAVAAAGSFGQ